MGNMVIRLENSSINVENRANVSLDEETVGRIRRFISTGIEMMKRTKQSVEEIEGTIVYPSIFKIKYDVREKKVDLF